MKTAIALGTFDGVHSGHRAVIDAAVNSGLKSIAAAFPEPPKSIISGDKNWLSTPHQKREILLNRGINEVFYLDFEKIRDMSPLGFLTFLKARFNPAVICCGFNYRFGKNGAGDTELLESYCSENGIQLIKIAPVCVGDRVISSTYIRELLENGEIELANSYLAEPFGFTGEVIHGDKRGRTIGFPTVNQLYPENLALVKFGVYKSEITVGGKTYSGITNIGVRPSFKTEKIMSETYINDFSGEIYGEVLKIRLLKFIRPEQKFESLEKLKENIENDIKKAY